MYFHAVSVWGASHSVKRPGKCTGQIRSFKIIQIDAEKKRIDLELQA
jgi:hypothetical protein